MRNCNLYITLNQTSLKFQKRALPAFDLEFVFYLKEMLLWNFQMLIFDQDTNFQMCWLPGIFIGKSKNLRLIQNKTLN